MKAYIHARLLKEDVTILEELKKATGDSESQLVRCGLRFIRDGLSRRRSALELAGPSAGKFKNGPKDLSTSKPRILTFDSDFRVYRWARTKPFQTL